MRPYQEQVAVEALRDEPLVGDRACVSVLPKNEIKVGCDHHVRCRCRHAVVDQIVADRVQDEIGKAKDDATVDRDGDIVDEEDAAGGAVHGRDAALDGAAEEECGGVRDPLVTEDRVTEYTRGRVVEPAKYPWVVSLHEVTAKIGWRRT